MMIPQLTLEKQDTPTAWYGCYDGGWQNIISDLSFRHPAKFSRSLVSRIYAYALERGYLKPGMVVLDPFGGVGLGSLDALSNGLSWLGCELERDFQILGQGCECTGMSKADWVRFYGRWEKVNYSGGRHWCPECLAEAKQVTDSRQFSLFEPEPSAAYTRNSGIVPETKPHYYRGNLDLFRKYAKPGTWAVLLNGDSRNLRAVIGQAQVDGLLSSPPYANGEKGHPSLGSVNKDNWGRDGRDIAGRRGLDGNYGGTDGQLANMPLGDALLSSPPYAESQTGGTDIYNKLEVTHKRKLTERSRTAGYRADLQGDSPGQLGAMPPGNLADSLLTSPPFAGNTGGRGPASRDGIDAALFDRHSGGMKKGTGENPANLDHLPMRGLDAVLTSPPFENQIPSQASAEFHQKRDSIGKNNSLGRGDYGQTIGQLGIEQGQTFWAAARQIVDESYLALKPGGYTFWVTKRFVRDGAIIDFTAQWRQLCEACGFQFVEHIQAMLIQSESEQGNLNGDVIKTKKKKASFFRRLHEKKFPHLAIDNEDILVMRKPEARQ